MVYKKTIYRGGGGFPKKRATVWKFKVAIMARKRETSVFEKGAIYPNVDYVHFSYIQLTAFAYINMYR